MKNKWMKIGGAALMTVAIVAAVIQHVRADESVKVSRLTSVKLKETFTTSGKLESAKKQEVYVQPERGEIKRVLVETGEKVAKGDRLVEYEGAAGGSTFVTSKMNGTVVRAENILVSGQGGNGPIVVVADMSQLKVVANISEFDIMKVKVGQSARVMTEAMPEKGWQGKVKDVGMLPNEHGLAEDEQVNIRWRLRLVANLPLRLEPS
ncbi:efflux RND transporter periplasmic adaptor subunit [Laceyella putida]|uniref:Efflux RND transporter periplasmic adaptor subunit n=1 Tax=Laceyella putida TaxID=110101 RepID=A0ABW2RP29_9BACL